MNKVLLTGRLTRDPELRSLASGSSVATFAVATNEYRGNGKERAEYHNVVVWDRLAQVCGQYLGKGQQVAIEGRLQTRQWDDDRGARHCQVRPQAGDSLVRRHRLVHLWRDALGAVREMAGKGRGLWMPASKGRRWGASATTTIGPSPWVDIWGR